MQASGAGRGARCFPPPSLAALATRAGTPSPARQAYATAPASRWWRPALRVWRRCRARRTIAPCADSTTSCAWHSGARGGGAAASPLPRRPPTPSADSTPGSARAWRRRPARHSSFCTGAMGSGWQRGACTANACCLAAGPASPTPALFHPAPPLQAGRRPRHCGRHGAAPVGCGRPQVPRCGCAAAPLWPLARPLRRQRCLCCPPTFPAAPTLALAARCRLRARWGSALCASWVSTSTGDRRFRSACTPTTSRVGASGGWSGGRG